MQTEIEKIIEEKNIEKFIFDFHRCAEKRDWDLAKPSFANTDVEVSTKKLFGELSTKQRFVLAEKKVGFSQPDQSKLSGILLNIGGVEGPKIQVCGFLAVQLKKSRSGQWQISSYEVLIDSEMHTDYGALW